MKALMYKGPEAERPVDPNQDLIIVPLLHFFSLWCSVPLEVPCCAHFLIKLQPIESVGALFCGDRTVLDGALPGRNTVRAGSHLQKWIDSKWNWLLLNRWFVSMNQLKKTIAAIFFFRRHVIVTTILYWYWLFNEEPLTSIETLHCTKASLEKVSIDY